MWQHLMTMDVAPISLIIRAVVVYLSILLLLRLGGKRQMAQMSPTEFVAILLISNAVQNSMNGGDNSLGGGLLLALVLIVMSSAISYLTYRSKIFSAIFEGVPTLLVHNGEVIYKNLKKERISVNELESLLRRHDVHSVKEVTTAILEPDGSLTIIR